MMSKEVTLTQLIEKLEAIAAIHSKNFAAIIENSRWLASLVLAEMGALAGYQKLVGAAGLSIPFAFVVLLLAVALACFVIAAQTNRHRELKVGVAILSAQEKLAHIVIDSKKSEHDMTEESGQEEGQYSKQSAKR